MAIQFPSNPVPNQLYTYVSHTWEWNTKGWALNENANIGKGFTLTFNSSIMISITPIIVPSAKIVTFIKAP